MYVQLRNGQQSAGAAGMAGNENQIAVMRAGW